MKYDWDFVKTTVSSLQKDKRYRHTIGVANEALNLGRIFLPQKLEKLYLTGLLHDITKDLTTEKHFELCSKYDIKVSKDIATKLLHAKTGASYAEAFFGKEYVDNEVFNGIYYHTTGRENMTLFEMIIYLADYIEDGRTFSDCVYLRNYFYQNIEDKNTTEQRLEVLRKTMVLSFDLTIKNLILEEKPIDFDTINARNYFLKTKLEMEKINGEHI